MAAMSAAFISMVPLLVYGLVAWFVAMVALLALGLVWLALDWPGAVPLSRFAAWFGFLTDAVFSLLGGFAMGAFAVWDTIKKSRTAMTDLPSMAEYIIAPVVLGVLSLLIMKHGWHTLTTRLRGKTR